jgi:Calcium binding
MPKNKNEEIEHRIHYEIIVDAYDDHEVKMGWYYYMEEKLNFPFYATVEIKTRGGGKELKRVEVGELTCDVEFGDDMTVGVSFDDYVHSVPLRSLIDIEADEDTLEAIGDWVYWREK